MKKANWYYKWPEYQRIIEQWALMNIYGIFNKTNIFLCIISLLFLFIIVRYIPFIKE